MDDADRSNEAMVAQAFIPPKFVILPVILPTQQTPRPMSDNRAESTIDIRVRMDENKVPESITWSATDGGVNSRAAKAMALAMWDDAERTAMHMDLWTKEMSVEEMQHFVCQTMMTLAATFEKSTSDKAHAEAIRKFTEELARRLNVID